MEGHKKMEFEDGTNTRYAVEKIYEADEFEEDIFLNIDYAMKLEKERPVPEGIKKRLRELGVRAEPLGEKEIIEELKKRYKKAGIGNVPRSVREWIRGQKASAKNRATLYNLCIALEMDLEMTKCFFLKNFRTIPFNYKDRCDAVYYYGILRKKSYKTMKKMLEFFEKEEIETCKDAEKTEKISRQISEIDDDQEFLQYVKDHSYGKNAQYQTVQKEIQRLIMENMELVNAEKMLDSEQSGTKINSISGMLAYIYQYNNQKEYREKRNLFAKSSFLPKSFKESFPRDEEIKNIGKKKASAEVLRKALIIMKFYNFYCYGMLQFCYGTDAPKEGMRLFHTIEEYQNRGKEEVLEDWEDFRAETNLLLAECGFIQLYARHPFDWILLFCAHTNTPLEVLREVLAGPDEQ